VIKHWSLIALSVIFVVAWQGCDTPEKLMKSTDLDYKYKKAMQWYNKKQYYKCIPVFEELMGLYKGTKSTEEIYYYYCLANYKQGDYIIAAYHFKNFFDLYPTSPHAEECLYLHAKSLENQSPQYELEQVNTYKAIEGYMLYLNNFYDNQQRVDSCNLAISKLRKKLEKKALSNAELYYKTGHYRAAATTFENLLEVFPDIDNAERIYFMIVKSNYRFAENSVASKKAERFKHVLDSYLAFSRKFPDSKYIKEAESYEQQAHFLILQGLMEHAQTSKLSDRIAILNRCIKEADIQKAKIKDEKLKEKCDELKEQAYFLIVKNYFLTAEDQKGAGKIEPLEKTVKSYFIFADQFKKSRYSREAEKIYRSAFKTLEKIKANG
jgi:outer membrane protein assembly factor BamD